MYFAFLAAFVALWPGFALASGITTINYDLSDTTVAIATPSPGYVEPPGVEGELVISFSADASGAVVPGPATIESMAMSFDWRSPRLFDELFGTATLALPSPVEFALDGSGAILPGLGWDPISAFEVSSSVMCAPNGCIADGARVSLDVTTLSLDVLEGSPPSQVVGDMDWVLPGAGGVGANFDLAGSVHGQEVSRIFVALAPEPKVLPLLAFGSWALLVVAAVRGVRAPARRRDP